MRGGERPDRFAAEHDTDRHPVADTAREHAHVGVRGARARAYTDRLGRRGAERDRAGRFRAQGQRAAEPVENPEAEMVPAR